MFIGVLSVRLYLSEPQSLKDKRRIVKSLIEKLKNKFNVAVAETGDLDSWNNSRLGIVCASNEAAHADSMLATVVNFIESRGTADITSIQTEIIPYS
ncbi:MAG: DUF503 domain-containing protein [Acetivibrionales bacterium]|mgnify:CR=1 FL=1|jgi:uncharacterized protein YlxP (DUF503 family)|nr:DUF503 domain-containing protein [Clostridiaceae bacterium]